MTDGTHVVALSGGKDSTALALALRDREPREYVYLCTPTGNELPELEAHWASLERLLAAPLHRVTNRTLEWWIDEQKTIPNHRIRWCTRVLKIEACQAWIQKLPQPVTLYVGLRADEEDRAGAQYGGSVTERYPLREWGWGLPEVQAYLRERRIKIPARTDCAWCFFQRIGDWWNLWRDHPDLFQQGIDVETRLAHTFRSPGRDTWPVPLIELRATFEGGRIPLEVMRERKRRAAEAESRRRSPRLPMFQEEQDDDEEPQACRVCRL